LRSLAEGQESRLIQAWLRNTKIDRRRFELLKRAYVEARYSPNYEISADDLEALAASACNENGGAKLDHGSGGEVLLRAA